MGLAVSWYTTWFSTLCQRSFPLAGSAPFLAPVRWATPAVVPCCWVGGVWIHHLVFYLVPVQLPLLLLTLSGCSNLSGSSLLVYSCGGALLLCWRCLAASLCFLPCVVLLLRGLQLAQRSQLQVPLGFSGHQVSVLLFSWWRRLGISPSLLFLCFSCSDWLAGVSWVLHPVSGCSSWGGVYSLVDSVVTLLAFPYLRVGELLDYGVSGVSWLRRRSRLPFVVRPPFHVSVCPLPSLGLGWLGHRSVTPPAAPRFWTLLELGCAVLTP